MQTEMREQLRERIATAIDEHGPGIIAVSDQIHKRPEIGYEERFASQLLADQLRKEGFAVEKPLGAAKSPPAYVPVVAMLQSNTLASATPEKSTPE